jgi:PAS domain S-box-containing protein
MALVDEEMLYVDVNPVHAQIFGRARDDIVGTRLDSYLPESELPTVEAEHNEFLSAGEYSGERRYIRADGTAVRVQYAAASETITGRKLALFVSNVVDEDDESNGAGASHAVLANGEGLSPREREVVRLVAMGMTSRQIAEELTVSTETVRTHIRNALAKTGTRTRAQLVAKVMAQGTFRDDG